MVGKIVDKIRDWCDFIKLHHTLFSLPFALAAMVVAARENRGWPGWRTFLLILGAVVTARSCAMSFNRIVDRSFDAQNPRTANRHLPTGRISLSAAIAFCIASAAAFVVICGFINKLCLILSPVALSVVCFYSLTKRFTYYSHFFLGGALALAPVGAWLAVRGIAVTFGELAQMSVLALAVVFWLVGFDIIYSLQDYEFDRRVGLKSLVVLLGPQRALDASLLAHFIMLILLALFGFLCGFRIGYFGGWLIIACCLGLEHWIARRRSPRWIQLAFFRLNALISVVFLICVVAEVVFKGGFVLWRQN